MLSSKLSMWKGYYLSIKCRRKEYLFSQKWYIKGEGVGSRGEAFPYKTLLTNPQPPPPPVETSFSVESFLRWHIFTFTFAHWTQHVTSLLKLSRHFIRWNSIGSSRFVNDSCNTLFRLLRNRIKIVTVLLSWLGSDTRKCFNRLIPCSKTWTPYIVSGTSYYTQEKSLENIS